jgi:hypothetical protein
MVHPPNTPRTPDWHLALRQLLWGAAFFIPPASESMPRVRSDGFPYFHVQLALKDDDAPVFHGRTLMLHAMQHSVGVAVVGNIDDPHALPLYTLSLGDLDNIWRFDGLSTPPARMIDFDDDPASIQIGHPSKEFLPWTIAQGLYTRMTQVWGIECPMIAAVLQRGVDPIMACDATPIRIDVSKIPFGEAGRELAFHGLSWFLPSCLPMVAADNPAFVQRMIPLKNYVSR